MSSAHVCPNCTKSYSCKGSLTKHVKEQHLNPMAFKCSVCNKSFNTNSTLVIHSRHHSGELPFSCPFCDKWFRARSIVSLHVLRKHTTPRRYPCQHCHKTFSTCARLERHDCTTQTVSSALAQDNITTEEGVTAVALCMLQAQV
jgi:KRAB domain-containing zinc finger protein